MSELALLHNTLLLGGILFALGLVGFLTRRNLIVMFLCAEMMLQGVSVSLVGWGRYHNDWGGQSLVVFMITVAACEAAVALALVLLLSQRSGKLDAAYWQDLREAGQPAHLDHDIPEDLAEEPLWPRLTPAGREPIHDPEEEWRRSRV
jgi:NADH-quinone oxidoreductase subunit K